jgi:zeta-carotene desaturase
MKAIVVGGGLAGMSAASALADAGFSVEILERSPRLGGRASSIFHPRLGVFLDEGQHVLLGCCTNLLHFYDRLKIQDSIRFHNSYAFIMGGEQSRLSASPAPEPLHLMLSLLHLHGLSLHDKACAGRLLWSALNFDGRDEPASKWLSRCGQSDSAIRNFWEPILVGALNESLDLASARYAAMVIREGMLMNRRGLELGIARIPLGEIHDVRARQELESRGVVIRTGTAVTSVDFADGRASGVRTSDGAGHDADYVVVAGTPSSSAALIASHVNAKSQLKPAQVAIVTLYLWFKKSLGFPHAACIPGGHFHWCFDRSGIAPVRDGMAASLSLVASAAKDFYRRSDAEILAIGLSEVEESFGFELPIPDDFAVVRYRNSTFSPSVDCDSVRPPQETDLPNLFLAGEWTRTGWPGTMEGAVRSGYKCAVAIAAREGRTLNIPLPDLQWGWKG